MSLIDNEIELHYKTDHNAKWVLVFHHDYDIGGFMNINETKYCNTKGKYSILSEITSLSKYQDSYEFLLEYPSFDYLRWQQKVNPIRKNEDTTDKESLGVTFIHNPYFADFRGLAVSQRVNRTYLDGDGNKLYDYWYSIGTIYYESKIPGPIIITNKTKSYKIVNQCTLWMRVPWLHESIIKTCHYSNLYILFAILL